MRRMDEPDKKDMVPGLGVVQFSEEDVQRRSFPKIEFGIGYEFLGIGLLVWFPLMLIPLEIGIGVEEE
jgi:hypothetical protein